MIRYKSEGKVFIIIDRNKTIIFDSRIGFLDLKALILKDTLESDQRCKLIAYMRPLMINSTDRTTIDIDNYNFYINKLLTSKGKGIKIQNDVLTNETVKTDDLKLVSTVRGILATCLIIYNCIEPDTTLRTAAHVAALTSLILSRTKFFFQ